MAHLRQKKVDLSDIDSRWTGCFVLVGTKSFLEVQKIGKEARKFTRQSARIEKQNQRLSNELEKETDEKAVDSLFEKIEKNEDELERLSGKQLTMMLSEVKKSFISGQIYDPETSGKREMKSEDMEKLDMEVIERLFNEISASISKKE